MNMLFRIIWCTAFIEAYLKSYGSGLEIGALMPKPISTTAAVATFATLRQLHSTFNGGITDYMKSGAVAVVFAIVLAFTERAHLLECYSRLRSQG
jgi:oligosaccharide translocation protein RFT1